MGVNVVATVENSRDLSLHGFVEEFESDRWGKFIRFGDWSLSQSWDMFAWQSKTYFVWKQSPRISYLGISDFWDDEIERGCIQTNRPIHLTFLKVMLAVERIAGGPVYVGDDVAYVYTPGRLEDSEYIYMLPPKLDIVIPTWRDIETIEIEEPFLIF